jgi:hypothetical protein
VKQSELNKLIKIPCDVIPGCGKPGVPVMIKHHVAMMCAAINEEWRLFSEGCLRNRYFREQVVDLHVRLLRQLHRILIRHLIFDDRK